MQQSKSRRSSPYRNTIWMFSNAFMNLWLRLNNSSLNQRNKHHFFKKNQQNT
jgi:hypothetical protein